jgi:type II secretory pathway pseudopilin PulG
MATLANGSTVSRRELAGITLIEMMVVLAVIAAITGIAAPLFGQMFGNQRVKGAARDVADAFMLARSEAIRSGNTHLVILQNALDATAPIVIVDDGTPDSANCTIDGGEIKHVWPAVEGVSWGTSTGLANGTAAPDDPGGSAATVATGASFNNASSPAAAASWVLFQPDGLPRRFTRSGGGGSCDDVGLAGQGGGAVYVTNTERDYAVVLSHLGTVRVHAWNPSGGGWKK